MGIEVVALRLSAGGNLLDLRYRITDPKAAKAWLDEKSKPLLVDPNTGLKYSVPTMAYVGALRQTSVEPQGGKTYFILFANPNRRVQTGQKLDLVLAGTTLRDIPVQ